MFNHNGLKMAWDWWQRICEHILHLRIPSPDPKYGFLVICFVVVWRLYVFWNPKRVSEVLIDQSLTGVGYIEADWKVCRFKIKICFIICTKTPKSQWKVGLTIKSWISGPFFFFGKSQFPPYIANGRSSQQLLSPQKRTGRGGKLTNDGGNVPGDPKKTN